MTIDLNTFYGLLATQKIGFFLIAAGIFLALILLFALFFKAGKRFGVWQMERNRGEELRSAREDALRRSRSVIRGLVGEQMAPFLPDFPCRPDECSFIGKPVDFIAFSGLSEDVVDEIVFIEVKTGGAQLSPRERAVQEAVTAGRVRYAVYRVPGQDASSANESFGIEPEKAAFNGSMYSSVDDFSAANDSTVESVNPPRKKFNIAQFLFPND